MLNVTSFTALVNGSTVVVSDGTINVFSPEGAEMTPMRAADVLPTPDACAGLFVILARNFWVENEIIGWFNFHYGED